MSCLTDWRHRALTFLTITVLGLASIPASAERGLSEADALNSFDQVWERVRDQYFDFERIENDWDQGRERLRPQAAEAENPAELRAVLHELLALIGESHFSIIPGDTFERLAALEDADSTAEPDIAPEAPQAATGLAVRWIDETVRVSKVRPGSPAERADIQPGWSVVAVNDFDISSVVAEIAAIGDDSDRSRAITRFEYGMRHRLSFPPSEQEIEIAMVDQDGEPQQRRISGEAMEHGVVQFGNLPPMTFDFSLAREEIETGCVSVIAFSTWVPALADEIQDRRDEIFACQGLVLDLRGNPGGVLTTMVQLANDLFDESALLGTLLRTDARLEFRAFPRRVAMDGTRLEPFSGPIAILIDGMSGSTSELFAAGMQGNERAKLFGERSAGMALPARTLPLASGDILMYAFADYQDNLGRRVEGVGVHPDYPVELTADNIGQQPDPVMQAALEWMSAEFNVLELGLFDD